MRKIIPLICVILCINVFFNSCKKNKVDEQYQETVHPVVPDLSTQINASVSGFVTNENGEAVEGATVAKGTKTTLTDQFGYFKLDSVDFAKSAGFIKVTKTGYFSGIRTFIPSAGKQAFIRLQLIPNTIGGTLNSDIGGTVSTAEGASVTLAPNSVVLASGNAPYTGTVNIAVHWLNPADMDVTQLTMPGNLTGIDSDGHLNALTTFGMLAVELTNDAGELLQIASGMQASLNFPIPASLQGSAPASIPLWYFDENIGLWKQDGSATKTGNNYSGNVSHFSYWNCDQPSVVTSFTAQIINSSLQPIPNVAVSLTIQGSTNSNASATAYTNSDGRVSGFIPINTSFTLKIGSECDPTAYTKDFRSTTATVDLGSIQLDVSQYDATFTGNITNCSGNPVTNGYVIIAAALHTYVAELNNGVFNVPAMICPNTSASVIAFDRTTFQQSMVQNFTLQTGANDFGMIQVCNPGTDEYITYVLDGVPSGLYVPYHLFTGNFYFSNDSTNIHGFDQINSNTSFDLSFGGADIAGTHSVIGGKMILNNMNYTGTFEPVEISAYGLIDEFITGTFSSIGLVDDFGVPHTITGTFNIKRDQ
ncbi:MAG: carboxypeptidase regulatory-like domain-containing protein [Ferruginibacter sp.]